MMRSVLLLSLSHTAWRFFLIRGDSFLILYLIAQYSIIRLQENSFNQYLLLWQLLYFRSFAMSNDSTINLHTVFSYVRLQPCDKLPEVGLLNQREPANAAQLFSLLTSTSYFQRHLQGCFRNVNHIRSLSGSEPSDGFPLHVYEM